MLSRLFKPLNIVCILCYILFMGFAFNSKIVDALVLYVSEGKGKTVYVTKKQELAAVTGQENNPRPLVAIKYSTKSYDLKEEANDNPELSGLEDNDGKEIEASDEEKAEIPTSSNDDDSAVDDAKPATALTS